MGRSEQAAEVLQNQIVDRAKTAKIPVHGARPVFGMRHPCDAHSTAQSARDAQPSGSRNPPSAVRETLMSGVRHRCGTLSLFAGASK